MDKVISVSSIRRVPIRAFFVALLLFMALETQSFVAYATAITEEETTTTITNGTYVSDDGITKQTWTFSGTNNISMKMDYLFINSEGTYRLDGSKLYITNTMFGSTSTSVYNISNITTNSFYIDDTIFKMSGSPADPAPETPEPTTPDPEPEAPPNPPVNPTPEPETPKPNNPNPAPNTRPSSAFLMGEDNYNFANSANSFGYGRDPRIPLARFQKLFTPSEAQQWYKIYYSLHGNCFGFSSSAALFNRDVMKPSSYQNAIDRAYRFSTPKNNVFLKELIELYQISQSLTAVNIVERSTHNNFSGLVSAMYRADGSVNTSGLMISVKKPTVGHSIIAYNITNAGGGVYHLSIYDNNFPNDTSRRMTVNTSNKSWQYDSYSSASGHDFRYLDSSVAYAALQTALQEQGQPRLSTAEAATDMYISIPSTNAMVSQDGVPISDTADALDVTPLTSEVNSQSVWFVPIGVYSIEVKRPDKNNSVVMFDAVSAFEVSVNDDAVISGTSGADGFITVDTDGKFTVYYTDNGKAEIPVSVSGKSEQEFMLSVSEGALYIAGNGKVKISQEGRSGVYELKEMEQTLVDLTLLEPDFPWVMLVLGISAAICIAIILHRSSRNR
jgi:hypothetical protein